LGFFLAVILLYAWSSSPVFAQEEPTTHSQEHEPAESESHHEGEHKNELALILAGTYVETDKKNHFTTGFEYERRLHPNIGISAVFEYITGVEAKLWVFPVVFHPKGGLKIMVGPGIEREPRRGSEEHDDSGHNESDSHDDEETSGSHNLFLFRLGAGYAFEFAHRYSITPMIELDLVKEEHEVAKALVYGVNFGIAF
jgi:hypothetical protein